MHTGDEQSLSAKVRELRRQRGLSQADLAEAARISAKTIQRLESCRPIAPASRRAVLEVLEIDPEALVENRGLGLQEGPWRNISAGRGLLSDAAAATSVEIEIDREGWRQARRQRPWYRQDLLVASKDPVERILDSIDLASGATPLTGGEAARALDALEKALEAALRIGWRLASRADGAGRLLLYIGSPAGVEERMASV